MSPVVTFAAADASYEQKDAADADYEQNDTAEEVQVEENMQAEENIYVEAAGVEYLCPVYKQADNPKSGLEKMETKTCTDYKVIDGSMTELTEGWYVLSSDVTDLEHNIRIKGDVHLILCDGKKYSITPTSKYSIIVNEGNSLSIYGQKGGTGELSVVGTKQASGENAAIGGEENKKCGRIEINGGILDVFTTQGAGIGGGKNSTGENIIVNGGTVNAESWTGAGIGGGRNGAGQNIVINGGKITAECRGRVGSAIGGGEHGSGKNITINGGTVTAKVTGETSSYRAFSETGAAIGGGKGGDGTYICINGGVINAEGLQGGAGIGGGYSGEGKYITINGGDVTAKSAGKNVILGVVKSGPTGAGIGGGEDRAGSDININGGIVHATGGEYGGAGIGGGEGGNSFNIELKNCEVHAQGGGYGGGAGIGGGQFNNGGGIGQGIYITDSKVEARGGNDSAGIGGGEGARGDTIHITNSVVSAWGEDCGAGIGGGEGGTGEKITIEGDEVTARGNGGGAGIGGGEFYRGGGSATDITIKGGLVKAYGSAQSSGIGGGADGGTVRNINITGGDVSAYGDQEGAGIGGGKNSEGHNITISGKGTKVYAQGGVSGGAGIGGARNRTGAEIYIKNGATVTARGFDKKPKPSAIGGGSDGDSFRIYVYKESIVRADNNYPPQTVVPNDGGEIQRYTHARLSCTVVPKDGEQIVEPGEHSGTWEGFIATGTASKTENVITWNDVADAEGYDVYFARCGNELQKVATVTGLKYIKNGLDSKRNYKYMIKAYVTSGGEKEYIAETPLIHVAGSKTKYSNATKLTAKPESIQVKVGKTVSLNAKITKKSKKNDVLWKGHTASKIQYMSTDNYVATVSSKGKIKAVNKGIAYIYAYAANGAFARVTVIIQ